MFTPSNMLLNYMNAQPRDVFDIVGALMGYINADPQFKTDDFEQAVQYVLSHGVTKEELFADFDPGVEFEEDKTKWNEEYYSFARVYLKDNFCEKRINHVKAVAKKLYPVATQKQTATAPVRPVQTVAQMGGSQFDVKKSQSQQCKSKEKDPVTPTVKIVIVVAVVVLLALVIGLIAK